MLKQEVWKKLLKGELAINCANSNEQVLLVDHLKNNGFDYKRGFNMIFQEGIDNTIFLDKSIDVRYPDDVNAHIHLLRYITDVSTFHVLTFQDALDHPNGMDKRDVKLAKLILGFQSNHLVHQPHNFIIDNFERRDNGEVVIEFHIGEPGSPGTEDNYRSHCFNPQAFKDSINEIMMFLGLEGTYEKEGDGEELYNLLDNMNWVYQKIKDFRRKGFENKKTITLDSDIGREVLKEYQKVIKEVDKGIRIETFGSQHRSTCHYMKYVLHGETDNISIRFFYQFGDREEYEGKFVMKDHSTKNYIVLHTPVALHLLSTMHIQDQYRVFSFPDRNKYIKLVIEGYYKDGERIPKGDRTVRLDSEKNTGTKSSPKMLKRIKQKEKLAKAPEELLQANQEIKELKREIASNNNTGVQDYINAYHSSIKQEYYEGIDINLDDIIDPRTQHILEELQSDRPTLKHIGPPKNYQSILDKKTVNGFIQMHLFGMTNENDAVSLVMDELNVRITYSEIQEILVRGSVLPK